MQFTPDSSIQEERLLLVEKMSADEILTKVTGREEVDLYLHMHNRHQIIYILSGTLHIEVEGVNHFVTDHHLVWIPAGISHRLSSNNRQISLLTSYFYAEKVRNDWFAVYQTDEMLARNLKFISQQGSVIRREKPEIFTFSMSFLCMLPLVCRKASFPTQPFIIAHDNRLLPVLEYIKANLGKDLSIENVASHFGFSVRNLTRLFTNSGIRFVHYLNYQRVVRAIEILTDNVMNIEQTAYEVGFNSPTVSVVCSDRLPENHLQSISGIERVVYVFYSVIVCLFKYVSISFLICLNSATLL